ncbi:MAG: M48 family metallopeptidase [Bifidobacteriaceae bacterium]|nr:M48 family metallopeptidase [Bifidobacteriaceae bacterium]
MGRRYGRQQARRSGEPVETLLDDIRVVVTRKPIKNLYLRVKPPDGHLEISAPQRMADTTIRNFVRTRRSWIDEMRNRVQVAAAVGALGGDAPLPLAEKWTPERTRVAKRQMTAQLDALLPKWTAVVGKSPTSISLRAMKTRWGSCTPRTGRIRLNLELADIPEQFLEYVLVHELTHLHASGHGPQFQRLMSLYLPNWRQLRSELNKYVIF